jgi:hypothetical protein
MEHPHISSVGDAPKVTNVQTVIVYSASDGRIMHKHEVITLEGGAAFSDDRVATDALEHATSHGHAPEGLATLHVDGTAIKRNVGYRIDPATRRLVEKPR